MTELFGYTTALAESFVKPGLSTPAPMTATCGRRTTTAEVGEFLRPIPWPAECRRVRRAHRGLALRHAHVLRGIRQPSEQRFSGRIVYATHDGGKTFQSIAEQSARRRTRRLRPRDSRRPAQPQSAVRGDVGRGVRVDRSRRHVEAVHDGHADRRRCSTWRFIRAIARSSRRRMDEASGSRTSRHSRTRTARAIAATSRICLRRSRGCSGQNRRRAATTTDTRASRSTVRPMARRSRIVSLPRRRMATYVSSSRAPRATRVATLRGPTTAGVHTVVWNYALPPAGVRGPAHRCRRRCDATAFFAATRAPFVFDSLTKAGYDYVAIRRARESHMGANAPAGGGRGGRGGGGGGRGVAAVAAVEVRSVVTACERPMTQWDPFCAAARRRSGAGSATQSRSVHESAGRQQRRPEESTPTIFDIIGVSVLQHVRLARSLARATTAARRRRAPRRRATTR